MGTKKPSEAEEEFFAREEAEKKRKLALAQAKSVAAEERQRLQQLHHLHCPKCGMKLTELALRGVVVERCFSCHGIFLDEADLERIRGEEGYWNNMLQFFAAKDYGKDRE
jgi:Zn-finger nucleic acid-binding protein